jgi:hypothetical protein
MKDAEADPYLAFAVRSRLAPADATKATHRTLQDACKVALLGSAYGMTAHGLAMAVKIPLVTRN